MSDRTHAQIEMGGLLPSNNVRDLYRAACNDNVGFEWGESDLGTFEEFRHAISEFKNTTLILTNDQAPYGTLPSLEAFCVATNLSFLRHSDACYEESPEIMFYTPTMDAPTLTLATQDGEPAVELSTLNNLITVAAASIERDGYTDPIANAQSTLTISTIQALIAARTPPAIPPLVIIPSP